MTEPPGLFPKSPVLQVMKIICDDRRHARGKVAKIATVTVYADRNWTIDQPDERRMERAVRKAERGAVHDLKAFVPATFGIGRVRCKLCGHRLPQGCGVAFGQAVWRLAIDGHASVRLSDLAAIIESIERR